MQPLPHLEWEPEPAPGIDALMGTAIQLWGQQPLLWLVILAIPNALAALVLAAAPIPSWAVPVVWLFAMVLGTAPAILAMAGQEVHEQPFASPWHFSPARWLRGTMMLLLIMLVTVAPTAVGVVLRSPLRGETALLVGLLLAVPFHALLAPSLVLAATTGPGGGKALWAALRLAEPRTWLHLLLILFSGTLLGVGLQGLDSALNSLFQGGLEFRTTHRVLLVAGVSLGESVWAAFITVCGLDALEAIRNPLSEQWELERLTE